MCSDGSRAAFFYPVNHGGARHAKGAGQAPQAAALFVRPQNRVTLGSALPVRLGVLAVLAATRAAQEPLLAGGRMTIFHQGATRAKWTGAGNHPSSS